MIVSEKPSNAAVNTKNIYAVSGLFLITITSLWLAHGYKKGLVASEEILSSIVSGIQPLAIVIFASAMAIVLSAALPKFAMYMMQFIVNFQIDDEEGLERDMRNNPAPFFMTMEVVEGEREFPKIYYLWRWEHSLFLAMALHIAFINLLS